MKTRLYVGLPTEGYVTDEVSTVPTMLANLTQETREKFVTDLAAVSRGKDESKNPSARFKALLKEAAPNSKEDIVDGFEGWASRPLEFAPAIVEFMELTDHYNESYWTIVDATEQDKNYDPDYDMHLANVRLSKTDFYNKIVRFSYVEDCQWNPSGLLVYTNIRTLLNAGVKYDDIPFIHTITYHQYGRNKDDLYIVIGGEKTSVYDISIDYSVMEYDSRKPLVFKVKDLLKSGYTECDMINDFKEGHCYVDDRYSKFKAIKLKIPMMVWAQWPMTHTQLSKESQSDRVSEGNGYWLPEGIIEKINNTPDEEISKINFSQEFIDLQAITSSDTPAAAKIEFILNTFLIGYPQECVQQILKAAGCKREIWSRAPYYFKYKECVVTGWYNDPTTWEHSFLERSVEPNSWKNWTQKETKEVLQAVRTIIKRK